MAKHLLLNVLVDVLGKYVEGLSAENLKVGVWSGKIELYNLKLKASGLQGVNLPVAVTHGSLKKLKLKIPWTALDSKPVRIEIDGIYLQLGPFDIATVSAEELKRCILDMKHHVLLQTEQVLLLAAERSRTNQALQAKRSYTQKLVTKIVDNIELSISNFHVRYEDSLTIPNTTFAAGVTLESITVCTTDGDWKENFVTRSNKCLRDILVHKLGGLKNAAAYWNTSTTPLAPLCVSEWLQAMESMIYKDGHDMLDPAAQLGKNVMQYIMQPRNELSLRLKHCDKPSDPENSPEMDIAVRSTLVKTNINEAQFGQIVATSRAFSVLERRKHMAKFRPSKRPTEDPRGWWKYAYVLITGKESTFADKVMDMVRSCKYKDRYMVLIKSVRKQKTLIMSTDTKSTPAQLTALENDEKEILEIEGLLPLQALLLFRRLSAVESIAEMKAEDEAERANAGAKKSTFFSYFGGKKSKESKELTNPSSSSNASTAGSEVVDSVTLAPSANSTPQKKKWFSWGKKKSAGNPGTPLPDSESESVITMTTSDSVSQDTASIGNMSDSGSSTYDGSDDGMDLPLDLLEEHLMGDENDLDPSFSNHASQQSVYKMKLSIECDASLTVALHDKPVTVSDMSVLLDASLYSNAVHLGFSIDNFFVKDLITANPFADHIVTGTRKEVAPKFAVALDFKNGSTILNVTANPIQVAWNPTCLQYLLTVLSPGGGNVIHGAALSKVVAARLTRLLQSDSLVLTAAAMSASSFTVGVELDAPKFIIPQYQHYESGKAEGFLVLDAGHMLINGTMAKDEMECNISLFAICADLPQTVGDIHGRGSDLNYLIQPFNILVDVQNSDRSNADMNVAVQIAPEICGHLSPTKIGALIRVANVVMGTMKNRIEDKGRAPMDFAAGVGLGESEGADVLLHNVDESDIAKKDIDVLQSKQEGQPEKNKLNATDCLLKVSFSLPLISVDIQYSLDRPNDTVTLSMKEINITDAQRPFDNKMLFTVDSVSIFERNSRCAILTGADKHILWTRLASDSDQSHDISPAFSMSFVSMTSKQSPYFVECGRELKAVLKEVHVNIDSCNLLQWKPFYASVMMELMDIQALSLKQFRSEEQKCVQSAEPQAPASPAVARIGPPGFHASFSFEKLKINTLRVRMRQGRETQPVLENAFALEMYGFGVFVTQLISLNADLRLKSFQVIDERTEFEHYYYKTLFAPSVLALDSENASVENNMINLSFKKEGTESIMEVDVHNATSFVSIDTTLDLASVLTGNVKAILSVLDMSELTNKTLKGANTKPIQSSSKLFKKNDKEENLPVVNIVVRIANPRIILFDDCSKQSSKALVAKCDVKFSFCSNCSSLRLMEFRETLNATLEDADVCMLSSLSTGNTRHMINPVGVHLILTRRIEKKIVISTSLIVDADCCSARVSVRDVAFIVGLLKRSGNSTKTQPEVRVTQSSMPFNSIDDGCLYDEGKRNLLSLTSSESSSDVGGLTQNNILTVFTFMFTVGPVSIVAVNDFNGRDSQILKLHMNSLTINANGPLAHLDGNINFSLGMDFYHPRLDIWESVVDTIHPEITVHISKIDLLHADLAIDIPHDLQLNISGIMMKTVLEAASVMTQMTDDQYSTSTNDMRIDVYPVVVENNLGVDIELLDSPAQSVLVTMLADNKGSVHLPPLLDDSDAKPSARRTVNFSEQVDLNFLGDFGCDRACVPNLAIQSSSNRKSARPKEYFTIGNIPDDGGMASLETRASELVSHVADPVEEELFENERYLPMQFTWGKPFLPNDPGSWADANGAKKCNKPADIALPNNRWEWVGNWALDKSGVSNKSMDEQGWEYGAAFSAFNAVVGRKPRTQQSLDVCRRRRWFRVRKPASAKQPSSSVVAVKKVDHNNARYLLVWDVRLLDNGSRLINICSGCSLKNYLPFRLLVRFCNADKSPFLDNVEASHIVLPAASSMNYSDDGDYSIAVHIPLILSHASGILVRPVDMGDEYGWSPYFEFHLNHVGKDKPSAVSNAVYHTIRCPVVSDKTASAVEPLSVSMAVTSSSSRGICGTFSAICKLVNCLPCEVHYKVFLGSSNCTPAESGRLSPGDGGKLCRFVDPASIYISFLLGPDTAENPIGWTAPASIVVPYSNKSALQCVDFYALQSDKLSGSFTMKCDTDPRNGNLEIQLCGDFLVVNYSDLDLSVRTQRNATTKSKSSDIVRQSFAVDKNCENSNKWIRGVGGMTMFQADGDIVHIGVGTTLNNWSPPLTLKSLTNSKTSFEIADPVSSVGYQLAYSLTPLPGLLRNSQELAIVPCFRVVNCTEFPLQFRQLDEPGVPATSNIDLFSVESKSVRNWHKSDIRKGTVVQFKADNTGWSAGTMDLNAVGSIEVILPRDMSLSAASSIPIVLHVEVKFADPADHAYLSVVVWQSSVKANTASLSVKNESTVPIMIEQHGLKNNICPSMIPYRIYVQPGQWCPYGWILPDEPELTFVITSFSSVEQQQSFLETEQSGSNIKSSLMKPMTVSISPEPIEMKPSDGNSNVLFMSVAAYAGGRVIRVNDSKKDIVVELSAKDLLRSSLRALGMQILNRSSYKLNCRLRGVGFSLIVERPQRREILALYVETILVYVDQVFYQSLSFDVMVNDIQCDLHTDTTIRPVLLHSYKAEMKEKGDENSALPVVQLSVTRKFPPGCSVAIYNLIAFRMLPLNCCVDTGSLQACVLDLHSDLKFVGPSVAMAEEIPGRWMSKYSDEVSAAIVACHESGRIGSVDVLQHVNSVQRQKLYIDELIIHPLKVTVSVMSTNITLEKRAPSADAALFAREFRYIEAVGSCAEVSDLVVKVLPFYVNQSTLPLKAVVKRYEVHVIHNVMTHMLGIAGSYFGGLDILGRPAGLLKSVGNGVSGLFYEPYHGLMKSPSGAVSGLGKGASGLVTGVVSGALDTTAGIVGSASKGLNKGAYMLTGDKDFEKTREKQRRSAAVGGGGGVLSGMKDGGQSVVTGFSSALTGLATKPYEGAVKEGAFGFVKGIGKGVMGVAVKPVVGVTDMVTSVAQGVSNQMTETTSRNRIRFRRALDRCDSDITERIVVPINAKAAEAQAFIMRKAHPTRGNYTDSFFAYVQVDTAKAIYLSDVCIFLMDISNDTMDISSGVTNAATAAVSILWKSNLGDISHFTFKGSPAYGVEMVMYSGASSSGNRRSVYAIDCYNRASAEKLYCALALNCNRFGNPGLIVPFSQLGSASNSRSSVASPSGKGSTFIGTIDVSVPFVDHYQFGQVNLSKVPSVSVDEKSFKAHANRIISGAKASYMEVSSKEIDTRVWQVVNDWDTNHTLLQASRCLALVVVNRSKPALERYIQIKKVTQVEGKGVFTIGHAGHTGYDEDMHSIAPGGFAVIFGFGFLPTVMDLAHVKLDVQTSAGSIKVATRKNRSLYEPNGGFQGGFVEKTTTDWWAKFVVVVE